LLLDVVRCCSLSGKQNKTSKRRAAENKQSANGRKQASGYQASGKRKKTSKQANK